MPDLLATQIVRDAETPSSLQPDMKCPEPNDIAKKEPVLDIDQIQGNILAGFKKDQQTLLFLKIRRSQNPRRQTEILNGLKAWIGYMAPFIATVEEVLDFNRLFKRIRKRRDMETRTVQATWINIAFSHGALKLLKGDEADEFKDEAFKQGMASRAIGVLGDPSNADDPATGEGHPDNWLFGGTANEADIVIIVQSDDPNDLFATVSRIEQTIYGGRTFTGEDVNAGVDIVYKQEGATLPAPLTGHEHFGFLDGVSQPGVRGVLSCITREPLTPRQTPGNREQGIPGQDLLWPGEFVFGYPGQGLKSVEDEGTDSMEDDAGNPIAPKWAKNGSFLVLRRLRQDVPGFHKFLDDVAKKFDTTAELLGAKLVGRWKSGAPILRAPDRDIPEIAANDCASNNFEFRDKTDPIIHAQCPDDCTDNDSRYGQSQGDKHGEICPFAGHIRKTYPRDDIMREFEDEANPEREKESPVNETSTQTHRMLRRGIPFGPPYYPAKDSKKEIDSGNRGLMFASYQTSIEDQFEFVQRMWANNPSFINGDSGHDMIIGQNNGGPRSCPVMINGSSKTVETRATWVFPTGGGYFFSPSISALEELAGVLPASRKGGCGCETTPGTGSSTPPGARKDIDDYLC